MTALLHAVLDLMQAEYAKPAPIWRNIYTLSPANHRFLEYECAKPSAFDPTNRRHALFRSYQQGKTPFEARECEWGRVIVLYENEHQAVPWELWGRILRCYASRKAKAPKACVYLLASTVLREFPRRGPITPQHINGGYTYHGNNQTIMIFRAEDATRVLIHELQHASSLDHMRQGVDLVEAETEAWAELLYAGFLSRGDAAMFQALVEIQRIWMQEQNGRVVRHIMGPRGFPWRYTIGKEEVWRRWGLIEGPSRITAPHSPRGRYSLRLGAPPQVAIKALHGVGVDSTIL